MSIASLVKKAKNIFGIEQPYTRTSTFSPSISAAVSPIPPFLPVSSNNLDFNTIPVPSYLLYSLYMVSRCLA